MIEIEKDIPIPPKKGGAGRPGKFPWGVMEIGDSFWVSTTGNFSSQCSRASRKYGIKLTVRKTEDGRTRVWRIE